jgi:general secretion pathway protein F
MSLAGTSQHQIYKISSFIGYSDGMPAFRYEALAHDGSANNGLLDAESAKQARSQLRARGLVPVDVQPVVQTDAHGTAKKGIVLFATGRLNTLERALFTRQLASLLQAGLPLERALTALGEEAERDSAHQLIAQVRSEVASGSTFATALAQHPRDFDELFRAVVGAGEESGQLGTVLAELADYLENRQALRSKLVASLTYPIIVFVVAILIVALLLGYVVPQVITVYANAKQKLPLLTTVMMSLSDILRGYWWLILAVCVVMTIVIRAIYRTEPGRLRIDTLWLKLPVLGRLSRSLNTARFASTLAILVNSGVPILRALLAAAQTVTNSLMKNDVEESITLIREGSTLASALALRKRFPPVLLMFIKLGEQTGQLPQMLKRAAKQHSDEVERRTSTLTAILEPVMILAMGVVVLLIVLAVLLPIMQLNSLVK